mmetsp:Transcript_1958/g.12356  ORF Transcript_1958/g.12356 Transcript_1958/m.12356 type:complete len:80 (+) Transcript_1958:1133-1372(+)
MNTALLAQSNPVLLWKRSAISRFCHANQPKRNEVPSRVLDFLCFGQYVRRPQTLSSVLIRKLGSSVMHVLVCGMAAFLY